MIESLYLPLVFVSALVGCCFAAFTWLNRTRAGALALTIFTFVGGIWAVSEALIIPRGAEGASEFWMHVSLSVAVVVPVAWLVLVLAYTGNDRWLTPGYLGLILLEPIVFVGLVWTNPHHGYVWQPGERVTVGELETVTAEFGLIFWGHQAYAYLLFVIGAAIIGRMLFRSTDLERWVGTIFIGSITLPVGTNLIYMYGFVPPGLNPAPIATVFAGAVLTGVILSARVRSLAPIAREIGREAVLEDLDDAIILLDDSGHVIDVNPAGAAILGEDSGECLGRSLASLHPTLAQTIEEDLDRSELELDQNGSLNYYDIRVSRLDRGFGTVSGRVVSLRNVTERLEREQRLDVLNRLLRHNIRNQLNLVRGEIGLAKTKLETHTEAGNVDDQTAAPEVEERLDNSIGAVDDIVDTSNKIGRLSRLLDLDSEDPVDLTEELTTHREIGRFDDLDGDIAFSLPETLTVAGGESLITAFEELIANGLTHNDSEHPRVTVTVDEERSDDRHVVIDVSDNGPGIDELEWGPIADGQETPLKHTSGVGLWLANWVIRRAGGSISFDHTNGTTVHVKLPRAEVSDGQAVAVDENAIEAVSGGGSERSEGRQSNTDES